MVTINAMVRVGPWTVLTVSKGDGTTCERCGRPIKEVWTCTVDADSSRLRDLDGQQKWRIGSTCGPTLIAVSEEKWKESTKATRGRLALALRLAEAKALADEQGHPLPALIDEREPLLLRGQLTERQQKHLGMVVGSHLRRMKGE